MQDSLQVLAKLSETEKKAGNAESNCQNSSWFTRLQGTKRS